MAIYVFAATLPTAFASPATPPTRGALDPPPSKSYILVEDSTGRVLSESNADERLPPASLTKIMVLLIVAEEVNAGRLSMTDTVTVTAHAASISGSTIWLEQGERMSVADLTKSVAIASANDAAVALAEHIAGNEEAFVNLMNRRAHTLGMSGTAFANASGLDEPVLPPNRGHHTTARDVATMSRALMREENHRHFAEFMLTRLCSVRTGTARETQLLNTNKLITYYDGIEGVKTGTTDAAGYCLSAAASRGEGSQRLRLISVVMGCPDEEGRLTLTESLLDYGFANFEIYRRDNDATPPNASSSPNFPNFEELRLPVLRGLSADVAVLPQTARAIVIPRGRAGDIRYEIYLPEGVTAPIEANQPVGTITATLDNEILYEGYILAATEVERMTFMRVFGFLVRGFMGF
jgi:D-alanyl-D-alanine carboxypeptidase (penicillin-binding protein 5/6)